MGRFVIIFINNRDNRSVKHPNVVQYYGLVEIDNIQYMVMEYANLGSLQSFSKTTVSSPLSIMQLVSIAKDIAAGMNYLATAKIVHRYNFPSFFILMTPSWCSILSFVSFLSPFLIFWVVIIVFRIWQLVIYWQLITCVFLLSLFIIY